MPSAPQGESFQRREGNRFPVFLVLGNGVGEKLLNRRGFEQRGLVYREGRGTRPNSAEVVSIGQKMALEKGGRGESVYPRKKGKKMKFQSR